jgi:hypothetical protein
MFPSSSGTDFVLTGLQHLLILRAFFIRNVLQNANATQLLTPDALACAKVAALWAISRPIAMTLPANSGNDYANSNEQAAVAKRATYTELPLPEIERFNARREEIKGIPQQISALVSDERESA